MKKDLQRKSKQIDGRKIDAGFKKKCKECGKEFMAKRSNARYCKHCAEAEKYYKNRDRNMVIKKEKLKHKLPKELRQGHLYNQLIEDISNAVIEKMRINFRFY